MTSLGLFIFKKLCKCSFRKYCNMQKTQQKKTFLIVILKVTKNARIRDPDPLVRGRIRGSGFATLFATVRHGS
jgi:hypothetical protein